MKILKEKNAQGQLFCCFFTMCSVLLINYRDVISQDILQDDFIYYQIEKSSYMYCSVTE